MFFVVWILTVIERRKCLVCLSRKSAGTPRKWLRAIVPSRFTALFVHCTDVRAIVAAASLLLFICIRALCRNCLYHSKFTLGRFDLAAVAFSFNCTKLLHFPMVAYLLCLESQMNRSRVTLSIKSIEHGIDDVLIL